jgi:hypothetical protein
MRRLGEARGIAAPSDDRFVAADAKREQLFNEYLDLAIDLAALVAAAVRSRPPDEPVPEIATAVPLELVGGHVKPPDIAGTPDQMIRERSGTYMRDAGEALRELVQALRGVDDPNLAPLIERCARIVRGTFTNPGI